MYTSYIHDRTYTSTIHLKGRWPHFNKVIKTPRIYTRFSLPLSVLRHLPSILPLWESQHLIGVLTQFTWQKKRRLVIHEAAKSKTKEEMKARRSRGRISGASPCGLFTPIAVTISTPYSSQSCRLSWERRLEYLCCHKSKTQRHALF